MMTTGLTALLRDGQSTRAVARTAIQTTAPRSHGTPPSYIIPKRQLRALAKQSRQPAISRVRARIASQGLAKYLASAAIAPAKLNAARSNPARSRITSAPRHLKPPGRWHP